MHLPSEIMRLVINPGIQELFDLQNRIQRTQIHKMRVSVRQVPGHRSLADVHCRKKEIQAIGNVFA